MPKKDARTSFNWLMIPVILPVMALLLALVVVLQAQFFKVFSPQNQIDFSTLSGEYDAEQTLAIFNNQKLLLPRDLAPISLILSAKQSELDHIVLGKVTTQSATQSAAEFDINHETSASTEAELMLEPELSVEKVIKIDLSNQRLFMYEGDEVIDYFMVSTGKWGRTPTGEFTIWSKFRYTKMSGGSRALHTYYYLPNVPYVMFFSNSQIAASRGFSIHGTYWHENFGTPMSHGCINMKTEHAEKVYKWANPEIADGSRSVRASRSNPGTKVIIYGTTPM